MKFPKVITRLSLMALLVGFVGLSSCHEAAQEHTPSDHVRFPAARMGVLQGKVWLDADSSLRLWIVESALYAYRAGYEQGCREGAKITDTQNPDTVWTECPHLHHLSTNGIPLAQEMTDFYTKYPADQDVPIANLIDFLIGEHPKSLSEIHKYLESNDRTKPK